MESNQTYKLLHSKGNHKQNKKTTYRMGKIFANNATDEDLIFKIYKQFTQLDNGKTENPIERRKEHLKRYPSKEEMQIANMYMNT